MGIHNYFFRTRLYAGVHCSSKYSKPTWRWQQYMSSSSSSGSCECYTWMQRVWTLWLQKWPSIWRLTCTSTSCVSQNAHTYLPYTYLWAENALIICHKKSHTAQSIQNSILQYFFNYSAWGFFLSIFKSFYSILETKSESWWWPFPSFFEFPY